jgi:hypothetical protein
VSPEDRTLKNTAQLNAAPEKTNQGVSLPVNLSRVFGAVNSPKGLENQDKHLIIQRKIEKNHFIY